MQTLSNEKDVKERKVCVLEEHLLIFSGPLSFHLYIHVLLLRFRLEDDGKRDGVKYTIPFGGNA
jgi:hypothetical protein